METWINAFLGKNMAKGNTINKYESTSTQSCHTSSSGDPIMTLRHF